jgi:hypothetical protein
VNARARRPGSRHPLLSPIRAKDCGYWAKLAYWSPEEATALWLGSDPKFVNSHTAPSSSEATEFARRLTLIERAVAADHLMKLFSPAAFVRWTDSISLPVHQKLRTAIDALPPPLEDEIGKLRRINAELVQQLEQRKVVAGTEPHPRERKSLRTLLAAMSWSKYRFDPRLHRNEATQHIVDDAERLGLTIDAETVLKHLRKAFQDLDIELPDR